MHFKVSVNHPTCTTPYTVRRYDWGESANEPNTFHFHEQYKGRKGFEAHAAAPHFKAWEEFASTGPFTKEPEVNFYELEPAALEACPSLDAPEPQGMSPGVSTSTMTEVKSPAKFPTNTPSLNPLSDDFEGAMSARDKSVHARLREIEQELEQGGLSTLKKQQLGDEHQELLKLDFQAGSSPDEYSECAGAPPSPPKLAQATSTTTTAFLTPDRSPARPVLHVDAQGQDLYLSDSADDGDGASSPYEYRDC